MSDVIGNESLECRPDIRCLNFHGNQKAPISKLPAEVLLSIFSILRDWAWIPRTVVTRITHVCREWRYIAIGAPLLWTRPLSSYRPEWTTTALQRARMAPIEVDLHFRNHDGVTDISKTLLRHISHTSKLEIYGPCDHLNAAQELIPEDDAKQLKELKIWCSDSRRGGVELMRPFVLSSTTFRHTHQLRHLSLYWVDVDFNSPLFRNLHTLKLSHLSFEAVPTWFKLLEVLRAMPCLEDLALSHVFPRIDSFEPMLSLEPLCLDSLHSLSLKCSTASQLYVVLGFVLFSALRSFNVEWDANDLGPDSTIVFTSIAEAVNAKYIGGKVDSLEVHQHVESSYLKLWASTPGSSLTVAVPANSVEFGDTGVITDFIDALCMHNLNSLKLKVVDEYSHDALLRLVDKMPILEDLTVANVTAFNFVDILGMEPLTPQSEPSPQLCLPKLESITWTDGDFSGYGKWVDEVAVGVFLKRQERGVGVKSLEFGEVENLSPEFVALFEKGVTEVVVYEIET